MKKKTYEEDLILEVQEDFAKRRLNRKGFEAKWKLNNNFFIGNQYSGINSINDIENYDKQFYWQEREVFNHIAPIVETRLSKLSTVRPKMNVIPTSSSESDMKVAKLSRDILKSVYQKLDLNKVIIDATIWSEITGTSFYKIVWNSNLGKTICVDDNSLKDIKEGEVEIEAVSPYEIFPDNQNATDIDKCESIIHAKAYSVREIKNIWGVDVKGGDVDVFNLSLIQNLGGLGYKASANEIVSEIKKNHAIVIEKYEAPSIEFPNGRTIIVCEDKLLYVGELPYINQIENKRGFPFVRQACIETPGCFWGTSIIERLIPVQRAYNAVKNRKHEYLNRLSMGVLTVEDGSVDIENLEEEGLSPGKVLIYRQGSNPPKMMDRDTMPNEFSEEEDKLLAEFTEIGGVNNILTSSNWSKSLSGTALELMLEQDSARINITSDNIRNAVKNLAKQILKLYKQFAVTPRLLRVSNSNGQVEIVYWQNSDIGCEEIEFDTTNEHGESVSYQREQILKLLNAGLLYDDNGKMSNALRLKVLELFGLGVFEGNVDNGLLQKNYADEENIKLIKNPLDVEVLDIDDNEIHINSHIAFMLDKEYRKEKDKNPLLQQIFLDHIKKHKEKIEK